MQLRSWRARVQSADVGLPIGRNPHTAQGSALADYDQDGQTLLGLHFAGQHARQNWAHALERITPDLAQFLPPPG